MRTCPHRNLGRQQPFWRGMLHFLRPARCSEQSSECKKLISSCNKNANRFIAEAPSNAIPAIFCLSMLQRTSMSCTYFRRAADDNPLPHGMTSRKSSKISPVAKRKKTTVQFLKCHLTRHK